MTDFIEDKMTLICKKWVQKSAKKYSIHVSYCKYLC